MKVNVTTTNDLSGNIMSYKFTNDEYAYNYRARDKATAIKWVMDVTDYDCNYDKNGKRVRRNFRIASPETYVYVFCNNGESYLLNEMETYPIKYLNEANTIVIDTPDFSMIYGDSMKFVVDTDGEMIREYERDEYYDDCFDIPDEDGDYEIGEIEPEESIDESRLLVVITDVINASLDICTKRNDKYEKGVCLYGLAILQNLTHAVENGEYTLEDMISDHDIIIKKSFGLEELSDQLTRAVCFSTFPDWQSIRKRLGERRNGYSWCDMQYCAVYQALRAIYTAIYNIYIKKIAA